MGDARARWAASPSWAKTVALFALLAVVPFIPMFDEPWLRVFFLVGLYVMLGLGLNVVVGFAGLLDLGYVAFFAVGAYTLAILSSASSPLDVYLNFWLVLPLGMVAGACAGLLLGLPVLPLRGDYLAIVTLGFGEIVRILLVNMDNITAGAQGISAISTPDVVLRDIDDPTSWYYFIVIAAAIVAFVTTRLRDSRVGRAWEAIREDEDVAAGMGINTVKYKLMAFSMGAAIGAVGGVLYASQYSFVNPSAFTLQVSVNVLALVIIGGMGSTTGIVFGSFILVGLPDILQFRQTGDLLGNFEFIRSAVNGVIDGLDALLPWGIGGLPPSDTWGEELADKRFIIYGALLVAIMVLRPAGLFPSKRRELEFENPADADAPLRAGAV
ncbi:MAG: ABC transporter ATP-binding protein [Anaerolinea sp.]|nr:ABC transporter ATP-binding protein [Anaerolinea sp.]